MESPAVANELDIGSAQLHLRSVRRARRQERRVRRRIQTTVLITLPYYSNLISCLHYLSLVTDMIGDRA